MFNSQSPVRTVSLPQPHSKLCSLAGSIGLSSVTLIPPSTTDRAVLLRTPSEQSGLATLPTQAVHPHFSLGTGPQAQGGQVSVLRMAPVWTCPLCSQASPACGVSSTPHPGRLQRAAPVLVLGSLVFPNLFFTVGINSRSTTHPGHLGSCPKQMHV